MESPPIVFDRRKVRRNRSRALSAGSTPAQDVAHQVLEQTLDRLLDVTRSFRSALVCGRLTEPAAVALRDRHGVDHIYQGVFRDPLPKGPGQTQAKSATVIYDEEWVPFRVNSFDLIISTLCLHWVNDLPGALIQLRRCLQPDGLFLATMYGGQTLHELRDSLLRAETEYSGGVTPRISPFVDVRDAGNLLVRAGFTLPVTDADVLVHQYPGLPSLFDDLRTMGETNSVAGRFRGLTRPELFAHTEASYREQQGGSSQSLNATFEIVNLTGWAPSDTQQKPMAPGSAQRRLSNALGTDETEL